MEPVSALGGNRSFFAFFVPCVNFCTPYRKHNDQHRKYPKAPIPNFRRTTPENPQEEKPGSSLRGLHGHPVTIQGGIHTMMRKNLFPVVCLVLALLGGILAGCHKEMTVTGGGEQATTQSTPKVPPGAGGQTPGGTQSQSGNK